MQTEKNGEGGFWPDTDIALQGDECSIRKAVFKDKKHHVACCADENPRYCHKCPKNSCANQVAGITSEDLGGKPLTDENIKDYCNDARMKFSTKCRSSDVGGKDQGERGKDWFPCEKGYLEHRLPLQQGFDYNIDQYTICRSEKPTKQPTASPTEAPTVPKREPLRLLQKKTCFGMGRILNGMRVKDITYLTMVRRVIPDTMASRIPCTIRDREGPDLAMFLHGRKEGSYRLE